METENIQSLAALRNRKSLLRDQIKIKEKKIIESASYISDHWGWMLLSSFLKPGKGFRQQDWMGDIVDEAVEFGMHTIENPADIKGGFRDFMKNTLKRLADHFVRRSQQ